MLSRFHRTLTIAAAALAVFGAVPAQAQADDRAEAVVVKDYDLFVDLPTAFAFIKLPTGWKFVGKLDADGLRHLPEGTLTSLLPQEAAETRLAANTAPRKARNKL
jgi:hypothetical protein